jgi:NAD(P)H-hydrate epimerase
MNVLPTRQEWWRAAARQVWLPTAEEMAALDRAATGSGSIPERALIENAGREVARIIQHRWPEGRVVALAGSGHNGADALVALRTLHAWGRDVTAVRCGSQAPEPDVLRGWRIELVDPEKLSEHTTGAAVLLDGILGTGLAAAPREPQASIIESANTSGIPIAAVDGPSGANFSTGAVPGACIRATLTVSFGWPKLGLLRFPARTRCGDLFAVEIGFPPPVENPRARAITAAWVAEDMLRSRAADAHKGSAGYLTLVAGQPGMAGAAVLAARTAVRGGVGIVRVVSDPQNREIVQTAVPEAVFVPWDSPERVAESAAWADAIALGPGLGRDPTRVTLVDRILGARGAKPILLDADGLNLWEGRADALAVALRGAALLTPHPGEMARLLGRPLSEVLADPPAAARDAADRFGATVLLKGAPSWVAHPGEPLRVTTIATPALATGGMGDVLTGLAGAYLAAGLPPLDAASAALMVTGISVGSAPHSIGHSAADVPERLVGARAALDEERLPQWQSVLIALPSVEEEVDA